MGPLYRYMDSDAEGSFDDDYYYDELDVGEGSRGDEQRSDVLLDESEGDDMMFEESWRPAKVPRLELGSGSSEDQGGWADLPPDVVREITCRVPDMVVQNMRLVCKAWHAGVNSAIHSLNPKQSLLGVVAERFGFVRVLNCDCHCQATASFLSPLTNLKCMEELRLGALTVKLDAIDALEFLAAMSGTLTSLSLANGSIPDEALKPISTLSVLTMLDLSDNSRIKGTELPEYVGKLSSLTELKLSRCQSLKADGVQKLFEGVSGPLESVDLSDNVQLSEEKCLAPLLNISTLTKLDLGMCTGLGPIACECLAKSTSLKDLDLSDMQDVHIGMEILAQGAVELTRLVLAHEEPYTFANVPALTRMTSLQSLELHRLPGWFCEEDFEIMCKGLTSLRSFRFVNDHRAIHNLTSASALAHISSLTNLTDLALERSHQVDAPCLSIILANLKELEAISLCGCVGVREWITYHFQTCPKLKMLNLAQCRQIRNQGIRNLAKLTNLTSLNLDGLQFDTGIETLSTLQSLTFLNLDHCDRVFGDSILALSGLPNLTQLQMYFCDSVENYADFDKQMMADTRSCKLKILHEIRIEETMLDLCGY